MNTKLFIYSQWFSFFILVNSWNFPFQRIFDSFLPNLSLSLPLIRKGSHALVSTHNIKDKYYITHLLSWMFLVPDPITTQVKVIILSLQSDLILQIEFVVSQRLTIVSFGSTATGVICSITYCWLGVEDSGKGLH